MSVRVTTPIPGEFTVKRLSRVRIADGPLTIVLPEGLEQNARVKGIISDTAGNPLPSAEVRIRRVGDSAVGGASVNADGSFESVKLIAGSYWVQVKVPNVGSWNSPVHHVNRGEVWDLGSIRVPKAGMLILVVHPLGNLTKGAHSIVLRGDEPHIVEPLRFEFAGTESPPQPVAPGHYTLAVHCYDQTQDIADVRIEVDIRSGEETRLDIHLRAGGRRLFLFTLPKDVKLVEGDGERLQLIVRGESGSVELVTSGTLWEEKATIAARGTFVPGKYRLEALTSGGLKASGEFTVNGPSSQEETITTVLSR
jgi:hypothetical protein